MRNEHIIDLIENSPMAAISESELTKIRAHVADCSPCERAFVAAQVSAVLLKEGTAESPESFAPSPFFQTRVLAALRERQSVNEWSWARMWRATGALASSMVAVVAAIAVLTFAAPSVSNESEVSLAGNGYSAEEVILNQDGSEDQVTDAQVLNTLYEADEEK
jgi:anti-sigma-K factor RskA